MIHKLLQRKDEKKVLLLESLMTESYVSEKICSLSYQAVLVAELNEDFTLINLDIRILGRGSDISFINTENVSANYILMKLINLYAVESPSMQVIDSMLENLTKDTISTTDSLAEELHMTRQNLYKLIEKINSVFQQLDIQVYSKQSRIHIEGNPINAISQLYRYYSLHYRYVYPPLDFNVIRVNLAHLMVPANTTYLNKESLKVLSDIYFEVYGAKGSTTDYIEFFFELLEGIGDKEIDRNAIGEKFYEHPSKMVHLAKDLSHYFSDFLLVNKVEPMIYFLNTLILIIYSQNLQYRHFDSFIFEEDKELNPLLMKELTQFHQNTNNQYQSYFNSSLYELVEFFLPIYEKHFYSSEVSIYVSIVKSRFYEDVVKNRISNFVNTDLYDFVDYPEEADIVISDLHLKHPGCICISDMMNQINSPEFYALILKKITEIGNK